jgi:hypothetical protein
MPVLSLPKDKGAGAVTQQVAVVVTSIRHTVHVCQPFDFAQDKAVGIVVGVGVAAGGIGHGGAVAHGVVGIGKGLAGGVVGAGEAVEGAVGVDKREGRRRQLGAAPFFDPSA